MKLATLGALCLSAVARADESYGPPSDQSVETFANWYADFAAMRDTTAAGLNLSVYDEQALLWARTSFIQPQLMLHDKFIFDRASGNWTVTKYLDDVTARCGGARSRAIPSRPPLQIPPQTGINARALISSERIRARPFCFCRSRLRQSCQRISARPFCFCRSRLHGSPVNEFVLACF